MAKILVVDDDAAIRTWLEERLREAGHETVVCADGPSVLGAVRDHAPELVVMDVEMPGMGGREVCRLLKAQERFGFIPVILMTAKADMAALAEGVQLGADDFLFKPIQPLELLARVQSMLRLKGLQDGLQASNQKLRAMNERLHELSTTDPLMGIYNRLVFEKRLAYECQRSARYQKPLGLLQLDLDHFKRVNDEHGHPVGDGVLKHVAATIKAAVREVDLVARYGGEELSVALPETDLAQALIVAERIRSRIAREVYRDGPREIPITVSIGVAAWPHPGAEQPDQLMKLADDALYEAKRAGRNCVRAASPQPSNTPTKPES
ncbi:MAG TPA: diguanylate cyclase [Myxococcota bacterium]|nr:diguanylate cyclase [Myxococcota bacterium]HRY92323.1 diguanylate cyclase [Myxococcota bacterium]HSA21657.1 diguanylate cyclase [Myxococcota bacterium]